MFVFRVCLIAALGGLLFGYDTAVISDAIGFLQKHFELSAGMKGWAASSALLGCVIGVSLAGLFSDFFGRRKTLVFSGFLFLASAVGTALANSLWLFVVFRVIGGVGVGVASMASPMYIAEISPARIRGRLVSVNQFAIATGMVITYFVNYFIAFGGDASWNEAIGWRWMFAAGVAPSLLFLLLLTTVPESPRWLIERRNLLAARQVLTRIGGSAFAAAESQAIEATVAEEAVEWLSVFAPRMGFVLAIGVALAVLQQITGINVFLYYGPEIFKQVGSETNAALLQQVVVGAVMLSFTLIAIWTVDRLGRKPLMIVGATGMGISLAAMGAASQWHFAAGWMLLCILGYIAAFSLSVGPVVWVILSEIFPNRVRGRAMALATFALWTANFVVSQTFPMMDEDPYLIARFHHGYPFYLYAAFCAVLVALVWMWVPETKGRSLEEIEAYWMRERRC